MDPSEPKKENEILAAKVSIEASKVVKTSSEETERGVKDYPHRSSTGKQNNDDTLDYPLPSLQSLQTVIK